MSSTLQSYLRSGGCKYLALLGQGTLGDKSGNGNDGTYLSGAISKRGMTGSYNVAHDAALSPASSMTVMVTGEFATERGSQVLVNKASAGGVEYTLKITATGVEFVVDDTLSSIAATISISRSIAVTSAGSAAVPKLYVDGAYIGDFDTAVTHAAGTDALYIGRGYDGSLLSTSLISTVAIYDSALSAADVLALHTELSGLRWPSKAISRVYDLSTDPPTLTKAFFDRGLIASGKTFSSGFIENSGLFVNSDSGKIETQIVNGYESKVLVSTGAAFGAYIPISQFGVNPKQAAYGTWNFAVKKGSGDLCQISFVGLSNVAEIGDYRIRFEAANNVRVLEYGISSLFDTVTVIDNYTKFAVFRITRDYSGTFKFWIDGTQIGTTATNTTVTESKAIVLDSFDANDCQLILQSKNPDYNFWYSPIVIEP